MTDEVLDVTPLDGLHRALGGKMVPFAGYAIVFAGGLLLARRPQMGLDLVAAGMLGLLAIAIRNSWAIAITIVSSQG